MLKINNDNNDRIIGISISLIPLFWILGIKFIFIQLLSIALFALNIKKIKDNDKVLNYSILFVLMYLISNVIAILINPMNFAITDFVGAIYGLSYWISGILLIFSVANSSEKGIDNIVRGIVILAVIQSIIFVLSIVNWNDGSGSASSMAMLYNYLPDALKNNSFLKEVMTINIAVKDYISSGVVYRFNGFYAYPVATALGSLYLLVYTNLLEISSGKNIRSILIKILKYVLIAILVLCIYYSRSRAVYLLIPVAIFATAISYFIDKNNAKYIIGIVLIAFFIGLIIVFKTDIVDKILSSRAGSSSERLNSYKYAFQVIKENPLFGIGDKFKADGVFVRIGSHSTLIGALVKSGVFGLIGIVGFLITVIIRLFKNRRYANNIFSTKLWISTTFLFFSTMIWMITEDIDWPQIVAFLFFLNVSIIFRFNKIVSND